MLILSVNPIKQSQLTNNFSLSPSVHPSVFSIMFSIQSNQYAFTMRMNEYKLLRLLFLFIEFVCQRFNIAFIFQKVFKHKWQLILGDDLEVALILEKLMPCKVTIKNLNEVRYLLRTMSKELVWANTYYS